MADPNATSPAESKAETAIMLGVLNAVADNATVTQRSVAKELGIALGLANAYVKRCIKKGLIKAQQIPANRYAYYLTPSGFAEKSRLTAEYLSQGFQFFRIARQELDAIYAECERRGLKSLALHGLTDLAEIALTAVRDHTVSITAIVDSATERTSYGGIAIVRQLSDLPAVDAVIITDLSGAQSGYEAVAQSWPDERIFIPKLLNVSRSGTRQSTI